MPIIVKYLTDKIREDAGATVLPLDPFQTDRVILPFATSKRSDNF